MRNTARNGVMFPVIENEKKSHALIGQLQITQKTVDSPTPVFAGGGSTCEVFK